MTPTACSLHPLDKPLLQLFLAAVEGGTIPDLKAQAARRRQRDLLINWSRKIARVADSLATAVTPDQWTLFTQLRPFFITATDPAQVAQMVDDMMAAQSLEEVLDLFREEVARLNADQADTLIEAAQKDATPGDIEHVPVEEVEANLRAYLLYQRHKLEAAATASPDALPDIGRLLGWRTCMFLANVQPWWYTRATSLTTLAGHQDLGLLPLTADTRGMYRGVAGQVPGLMSRMPFNLMAGHRTGLCIARANVMSAIELAASWPSPIAPDPVYGIPVPVEVQAVQEALIYAHIHGTGLWEAADLVNPEQGQFPTIGAGQGEVDETLLTTGAGASAAGSGGTTHLLEQQQAYVRHLEPAAPQDEEPFAEEPPPPAAAPAPAKAPFWKKYLPASAPKSASAPAQEPFWKKYLPGKK